jgi:hypothetical protein
MKKFLPAFPNDQLHPAKRARTHMRGFPLRHPKPSNHNQRLSMMYKTGAVSAVTGVAAAKLGRWQDRKTLKPSRLDKASTGSGDHRLFSRATIYQIAIAKAQIDLGIAATPANAAASLFTGLNDFGRTLLVIGASGSQIVNADFNAPLTDICGRPFKAAIIVDVGAITKTIDDTLLQTRKTYSD